MQQIDSDDRSEEERPASDTVVEMKTGLFRATLLFGFLAIVLALVVAPAAREGANYFADSRTPGIDDMMTGSIGKPSHSHYVIRRSVLQSPGAAPCLVEPGMEGRGGC